MLRSWLVLISICWRFYVSLLASTVVFSTSPRKHLDIPRAGSDPQKVLSIPINQAGYTLFLRTLKQVLTLVPWRAFSAIWLFINMQIRLFTLLSFSFSSTTDILQVLHRLLVIFYVERTRVPLLVLYHTFLFHCYLDLLTCLWTRSDHEMARLVYCSRFHCQWWDWAAIRVCYSQVACPRACAVVFLLQFVSQGPATEGLV